MSSTASRLDIYNMALGFIGARTIASPNENCNEAIQCELYWDRARRSALRDYPSNFAVQRVQLAETIVPSVYCDEQGRPVVYQHAYALPNKCLKVMRLHRLGESPLESHEFRLETYEGVGLILCDRWRKLPSS